MIFTNYYNDFNTLPNASIGGELKKVPKKDFAQKENEPRGTGYPAYGLRSNSSMRLRRVL